MSGNKMRAANACAVADQRKTAQLSSVTKTLLTHRQRFGVVFNRHVHTGGLADQRRQWHIAPAEQRRLYASRLMGINKSGKRHAQSKQLFGGTAMMFQQVWQRGGDIVGQLLRYGTQRESDPRENVTVEVNQHHVRRIL